jgi:hypothetical protein
MAGVSARPGADAGQAVDPYGRGLAGQGDVDDVGEDQPAIALHRLHHRPGRAQGCDHDRRLVARHQRQIVGQPGIGRMGDQIGDPWPVARLQAPRNSVHPLVQLGRRAAVGGRKRAPDAGPARRCDQLRAADQEHWRGDHRQAQGKRKGRTHAWVAVPNRSRNSRFSTLPTGFRGRASTTSSRSICLKTATCFSPVR